MQTDSLPLIDLVNYRKKHHLKQSELARFFGTTASYVSLVETGNSKLSRRSLEEFWQRKDIDHTGLVPCYDRLVQLAKSLCKQGLYDNGLYLDLEGRYFEPFEDFFTRDFIYSIKFGQSGITDEMAELLKQKLTRKINKKWLIEGTGDMFIDDTPERIMDQLGMITSFLEIKMSECHKQLGQIENKLDIIIRALKIS